LAVVFKKQEISQQLRRIQDVASEFWKIFRYSWNDTPGPSQREGTTPSHNQHTARPLDRRGALCPGVGTRTLVPSTFQPWLCPWEALRNAIYKCSTFLLTYKTGDDCY